MLESENSSEQLIVNAKKKSLEFDPSSFYGAHKKLFDASSPLE
jgi:hypothetical protein